MEVTLSAVLPLWIWNSWSLQLKLGNSWSSCLSFLLGASICNRLYNIEKVFRTSYFAQSWSVIGTVMFLSFGIHFLRQHFNFHFSCWQALEFIYYLIAVVQNLIKPCEKCIILYVLLVFYVTRPAFCFFCYLSLYVANLWLFLKECYSSLSLSLILSYCCSNICLQDLTPNQLQEG